MSIYLTYFGTEGVLINRFVKCERKSRKKKERAAPAKPNFRSRPFYLATNQYQGAS
jgi:hypothetical protein